MTLRTPRRLREHRCLTHGGPGFDTKLGQLSWFRIFRGFSSTVGQMSDKFRPHPFPDIISHNYKQDDPLRSYSLVSAIVCLNPFITINRDLIILYNKKELNYNNNDNNNNLISSH